jgi:hypothetical protein
VSVQSEEVHVAQFTAECDRCNKVVTYTIPVENGKEPDPESLPKGWMKCGDPRSMGSAFTPILTFHTRRCAVGWFRAFVSEQYGLADPGDDESDGPFTDEDAEEAGESKELLNAAYRANRSRSLATSAEDVAAPVPE